MLKELVLKSRSYRRFYQNDPVDKQTLLELVDLARLTPSARNLQPLKYMLSYTPGKNQLIFPALHWAGYLKPGGIDIEDGDRPAAYIIILGDRMISPVYGCDHGIAAQTILLGAVEKGLGGCIIGSVDQQVLRKNLEISEEYDVIMVIALGKPKEKVVIEPVLERNDIKYWRDDNLVHHVPKRELLELIVGE